MAERILLVDDSVDTLEVLERNLSAAGYQVTTAPGVMEALALLKEHPVDVVVTDLKMPRISGMDMVRHVRENMKFTEVLVITGYATVGSAVEAVKQGAGDFLGKPFTDDELIQAVQRACERVKARKVLQPVPVAPEPVAGLVGASEAMVRVGMASGRAAATDLPVLLVGERGTGKELVARSIHYRSSRGSGPFVAVHLAGIPEDRMAAELFGHLPAGATDPAKVVPGMVQSAWGGTLFLDDLAELPAHVQVQLLTALSDGEVVPVGTHHSVHVDVRVIAATHRDLTELVRTQTFRSDLLHKLSGLTVEVPPLRERGDDVLLLTRHFLARFAREAGRKTPQLTDRAIEALRNYTWPGNVRELESTVQRLLFQGGEETLDVPDLPALLRFSAPRERGPLRSLEDVETEHIRHVLAAVQGNQTRAAEILGIDRKTLREKLKRAGIAH